MLNDHSRVGIAQIILYVPAVASAAFLFYHHGRPRMPWILLFIYSNIRVAGGIIVILLEKHPQSVGLIVTSYCLLGAGVMPLIVATIGLIRIILAIDLEGNKILRWVVIVVRALFSAGVGLLVAGGAYLGNYKSSHSVVLGEKLVKAGYLVVAAILAILITFQIYLWTHKNRLSDNSRTILKGASSAIPFLVTRITYAFLSVFDSSHLTWNDLYGSVTAYVTMALLMEYIVVVLYIGVGFIIPPVKRNKREPGRSLHDR